MIQPIRFCPRCGQAIQEQVKFGKMRPICLSCGYIHFYDPKVAVVLFIEQNDRVLLVRRGVEPERGKWALVAGFVDRGEDPAQAARREMLEETGLIVEIDKLIDVGFADENGTILILYSARLVGGVLAASDDVEEAAWFGPNELPELAFESTRRLISEWLARLRGSHTGDNP